MPRSLLVTISVALVLVSAVLAAAVWLLQPGGPPLVSAAVSSTRLTPNADGDDDLIELTYTLRRPATLTISLLDAAGRSYFFRQAKARDAGNYTVQFGGVVDAYSLPREDLDAQVVRRVVPDGAYTWVVAAADERGNANEITGALTVAQADTALPLLVNFSVLPTRFSPNQDGIDDRARINVALTKDVPADGLRVYLIGPDGTRLPLKEQPGDKLPGQAGLHTYDYDAGIDQGLEPPADGAYTVRATAEDRLGQQVAVETQLQIVNGGHPRAEILLGEVEFSASSVVLGQALSFRVVVENYGTAPIRTTGPASGFIYPSMAINANTIGELEQSGAWRVGLHCQTCKSDYPWRWALGDPATLTRIPDADGRPHYYLMPGQRAVVTGTVVLDEIVPSRNPQFFWAGLIHEDVEVVNERVGPAEIEIIQP
ncbi:MAG: hypothetical protein IT318_02425 [Anaerolineales bacterium]|nr:hypothetical protein [Anaerolineales bacterium]